MADHGADLPDELAQRQCREMVHQLACRAGDLRDPAALDGRQLRIRLGPDQLGRRRIGGKVEFHRSVAEKFSWAAKRMTTCGEDRAYSLMGIFGVNMAMIYGEGEQAAFYRLQKEIFAVYPDHSIFAWDLDSKYVGT